MSEFIGKRIWIVEDEAIVAMALEALLEDLGCEVVGPATSVDAGLSQLGNIAFDAAILDVNLRGVRSDPIALELQAKGKLFMFATGYGSNANAEFGVPAVSKPYLQSEIETALRCLFGI